ncbi:hypothetical protein NW768_009067 [Fusarium equiseti]|uniref:Mitochondrial export translocase oxa2 n=1 Tax=Fusarium equiseti TaxID=61235 RepID=A0ABQ8R4H4_FUSEQ|nr:hypothetical protein NW768_009067 [Fusarium equiseti]
MSLLRRTAYSILPHARPFLPVTSLPRRSFGISHPALTNSVTSPCASRRGFSVASVLGDTVTATADSLSWAHSSGMPWYVAIPLLAVGINATVRFPLLLYARRIREAKTPLRPLQLAWGSRHAREIADAELPYRIKRIRISVATAKSSKRIYKAWGVQRWKSLTPLLGMVPFVAVSEALRRKCGAPLGWISHQIGLSNAGSVTADLGAASSMFDESLVNGGLLWFTDLSSADPYYGLPIICSGILVSRVWTKMPVKELLNILPKDGTGRQFTNRLSILLGRTLLLMPALPLLFADLPCAIFLYWTTSFALSWVNEFFLERLVTPKPASLTAPRVNKELPFLPPRQSQNGRKS